MEKTTLIFDDKQAAVINAENGYHLVLAPPGCGKTQILSERVTKARKKGISYEDMLCLTFTNRAARGMSMRVKNTGTDDVSGLFVGNIHKYCTHFIFNNNLVPAGTIIIDDVDTTAIILTLCHEDEYEFGRCIKMLTDKSNGKISSEAAKNELIRHVQELQHMTKGEEFDIPKNLINLKDFHPDACLGSFCTAIAEKYDKLKEENHILDFDDLLIYAYFHLRNAQKNGRLFKKYKWIQVDEVQDLNPLQLEIIDLVTDSDHPTVVYLGDEQQAIFSFMGAKLSTLEYLKNRCKDNIHHLSTNYRSPKYLLDIFNTYAKEILNVSESLLPKPHNSETGDGEDLIFKMYRNQEEQLEEIYKPINYYLSKSEDGRLAIIVRTNSAADDISKDLKRRQIEHIKVSGKDVFQQESIKLLMSHMSIMNNDLNIIPWTNIMMAGLESGPGSPIRLDVIHFLFNLKGKMLTPDDFIRYDGSSYVEEFCKAYKEREIVIFDTETTGLDIYEDDIVQIAAIKVRNGKVVPGSEFNIILKTDREIPSQLGGLENPLVKEYAEREYKYGRQEGLRLFAEYAGDAILIGHNVTYDRNILINNLKKEGLIAQYPMQESTCFDSLRLTKIIKPNLRSYKLKDLLERYGLHGKNSHLASDDIIATKSLLDFCYKESCYIVPEQHVFMNRSNNRQLIARLKSTYADLYLRTKASMYERQHDADREASAFTSCLTDAYNSFHEEKLIAKKPVKFKYIKDFIEYYLNSRHEDLMRLSLHEILNAHFIDISTFKEADFIESGIMDERVVIITVHKAKGLEFENVLVYAAVEEVYPSYISLKETGRKREIAIQEDARLLYVAMSRAKKRLCITAYHEFINKWGTHYEKHISRFMMPILKFFKR